MLYLLLIASVFAISEGVEVEPVEAGSCWVRVSSKVYDGTKDDCKGMMVRVKSTDSCFKPDGGDPDIGDQFKENDCLNRKLARSEYYLYTLMDKKRQECRISCSEAAIRRLRESGEDEIADWAEGIDEKEEGSGSTEATPNTTTNSPSTTSTKAPSTTTVGSSTTIVPTTAEDTTTPTMTDGSSTTTVPTTVEDITTSTASSSTVDELDVTNSTTSTTQEESTNSTDITNEPESATSPTDSSPIETSTAQVTTEEEIKVFKREARYSIEDGLFTGYSDVPQFQITTDVSIITGFSLVGNLLKGVNPVNMNTGEYEAFFVNVLPNWDVKCTVKCTKYEMRFEFTDETQSRRNFTKEYEKLMSNHSIPKEVKEMARDKHDRLFNKERVDEEKNREEMINTIERYREAEDNNQNDMGEEFTADEGTLGEDDADSKDDNSSSTPKPEKSSKQENSKSGKGSNRRRKRSIIQDERERNNWEFVDNNGEELIIKEDRKVYSLTGSNDEVLKSIKYGSVVLVKFKAKGDKSLVTIRAKRDDLESVIEFNPNDFRSSCDASTDLLVRPVIHLEHNDRLKSNNYLVCKNGTVTYLRTGLIEGIPNCKMVYLEDSLVQCPVRKEGDICNIVNYEEENNNGKLTIQVSGNENVHVSTKDNFIRTQCKGVCSVEIKAVEFVLLNCKRLSDYRTIDSPVNLECQFTNYKYVNNVATKVCREVKNASHFWWVVGWYVFGMALVILVCFLMSTLLLLCARCYSCCKVRALKTNAMCSTCNSEICYTNDLENHVSCADGYCPYCRNYQVNIDNLRTHVDVCTERDKVEEKHKKEIIKQSKIRNSFVKCSSFMINWSFIRLLYIVIGLLLTILLVVQPATSEVTPESKLERYYKQDNNLMKDETKGSDWIEQTGYVLDLCGTSCFHESGKCKCTGGTIVQRRGFGYVFSNLVKEKSRTLPQPNPTGFYNIEKTYKPSLSKSILSIEASNNRMIGGKLSVSGQSLAEIPIQSGTGVLWNISHPDSSESRVVSLSIYEYSQVYSVVHKHWIIDRIATDHKRDYCSGVKLCGSCGCGNDKNCVYRTWESDRGWNCNAADCWTISGGCTCCSIKAYYNYFEDTYLLRLVNLRYSHTELIICINIETPNFVCKKVRDGDSFRINEFEFNIGSLHGEIKKLPERAIELYPQKKGKLLISEPDEIFLNPDVCIYPNCKHGFLGDSIIYDINPLERNGYGNFILKQFRTQFLGVSIDRSCYTGYGPVCNYQNVVQNVTGQIVDLINTSEKINDKFSTINYEKSMLKVKPKGNSGSILATIKVDGMMLNRKEQKVEVNNFKINKCKGCRACTSGFTCQVSVSLKTPKTHAIHFEPVEDAIAIDDHGVIAEETIKEFNISLFTVDFLDTVKLRIKETGTVAEINGVRLEEPKVKLNPPGYSVINSVEGRSRKGKGEGSAGFLDNIWAGIKGLFSAGWALTKWVFSSWSSFLLYLLIVVIFLFLFAPRLFRSIPKLFCWKMKKLEKGEIKEMLKRKKEAAKEKFNKFKENMKENAINTYRKGKKRFEGMSTGHYD